MKPGVAAGLVIEVFGLVLVESPVPFCCKGFAVFLSLKVYNYFVPSYLERYKIIWSTLFVVRTCRLRNYMYIYRVFRILYTVRSVARLINNVCILLDNYYHYIHLIWINRVCTIDIAAIE